MGKRAQKTEALAELLVGAAVIAALTKGVQAYIDHKNLQKVMAYIQGAEFKNKVDEVCSRYEETLKKVDFRDNASMAVVRRDFLHDMHMLVDVVESSTGVRVKDPNGAVMAMVDYVKQNRAVDPRVRSLFANKVVATMKNRSVLASYFRGNKEEALFTGLQALTTSDPVLKRLLKQKQQMESEYKAFMQKHKLGMEDINQQIAARREAMKQERERARG